MLASPFPPRLYTVGGTVLPDEGIYIPRRADADLLDACLAQEYAYVLTARQMGKSSLMVRTARRLEAEQTNAIIIDLNELGVQMSVEEWYLGLMFRIASRLDLQANLLAWWRDRATMGVTQRLSLFFQEVVLPASERPIVVFIDEIDTTLSLDFTDDFFAALRYLYNARSTEPILKRLSFVLIGVATPSDLINDAKRTPFNIGRRIDLTDFTLDEALPLATGLPTGETRDDADFAAFQNAPASVRDRLNPPRNQPGGVEQEPANGGAAPSEITPQQQTMLARVIHWTGGHPYLSQRLCSELAHMGEDQPDVDQTVADIFLGENSYKDNNIQFVRDMLTKRVPDGMERDVLATYERVRLSRQRVRDEEQAPAKTHLKLSGIVKRRADHGRDDLVVRNRIYERVFDRRWIRNQWPVSWWQLIPPEVKLAAGVSVMLLIGLIVATWFALQQQQQSQRLADDLADEVVVRTAAEQEAQANAALAATRAAESNTNAARAEANAAEAEANAAEAEANAAEAEANAATAEENAAQARANAREAETNAQEAEENARLAEERAREAEAANQLAQARTLANESRLIGENEPQLALLLAIESLNLRDTLEGRLAIQQALDNPGRRLGAMEIGNFLFSFTRQAWSPDGSRLFTIDSDAGAVTIWEGETGQALQTLEHEAAVAGAWHPDGERLITAAFSDVRIWQAADGEVLAVLDQPANIISLSNDQTRLAMFDYDSEEISIWDIDSQERLQTMAVGEPAVRLRWHPDDTLLLAEEQTNVSVWDVESGDQVHEFEPQIEGEIVALSYSATWNSDGSRILVHNPSLTTGEGNVVVWSTEDGELLLDLSEPTVLDTALFDDTATPVSTALWGNDDTILALTVDNRLLIWDGTTGDLLEEQNLPVVSSGEIAEDGQSLLLFNTSDTFDEESNPTGDAALIVWNIETGQEQLRLASSTIIQGFHWSEAGQRLATYDTEGSAVLWDLTPQVSRIGQQLDSEIETVDWSPEGTHYYAETALGEFVVIEGEREEIISRRMFDGFIMQSDWHENNEELLVAPIAGPIELFDIETGETVVSTPLETVVIGAFFSDDSRRFSYNTLDGATHLVEAASGEELFTLPDTRAMYSLFSDDGAQLITPGMDGRVAVWEVAAPEQPTHEFQLDRPVLFAFLLEPDNEQVLTISHASFDIFGIAEGRNELQVDLTRYSEPTNISLWSLDDPEQPIYSVEIDGATFGFLNDGSTRLLLHTSTETPLETMPPLLQIMDVATGEILFATEQPSPIASVQWSDDSDKFFVRTVDGRVRVWTVGADDLPLPESLITLAVDGTRITAADWRSDGDSVLVGTANGRVLSLSLDLETIAVRACADVYRNLTPAEWEQYLPSQEYRETCLLDALRPAQEQEQ